MAYTRKRRARKGDESPTITPLEGSLSIASILPSTEGSLPTASVVPSMAPSFHHLHRKRFHPGQFFSHVIVGIITLFLGWQSHRYFSTSRWGVATSNHRVKDPPWWLEAETDDFFSRTYMSGLSSVRDLRRNTSFYFTGLCGHYRFDDSAFPSVSVIITTQNEQSGMLTLTVHTLLARTPPSILQQIIIVDDNGKDQYRQLLNESEFNDLPKASEKVIIITNTEREGVARSRMRGARKATGDVLMFIDSHVEMLSGTWAQHLLLPILENPLTLAAQTLDIISDLDWTYGPGSGDLLYGVINTDFWFSYQRARFGDEHDKMDREAPGRRLPYETPFVAGSLFAVRRDTFETFGGYDEGMFVWGGENTDFAIKVWTCGGRVVMVPCSRVGHMYRIHIKDTGRWPPTIPQELLQSIGFDQNKEFRIRGGSTSDFTKVITRNNIRVLERWARSSTARTGYYQHLFGGNGSLPDDWKVFADQMDSDTYAIEQRRYIRKNGCRNFDWFDKHVYVKLTGVHHPWHPNTTGKTWV